MAWYDEAVFYHIYPLGMTGAPKENTYGEPVHRLRTLFPWIAHIKEIGCNAIYIGPLFESAGHGYETTDYKKLDSRLGENQDLTDFVKECHNQGIRVILDGVFNHTGRDFFAFKDLQQNREQSRYKDWYCNVNFGGNNEYNDGFSYENWGGYNLLVRLNQHNPEVGGYICDVIRFWVKEFDIDGIRLDAADVLDFSYMRLLRQVANEVKPDFWLMGEVIHGDYSRWVNEGTLHSVTNYQLHKALYSGHNDHNYFEIAHTIKRLNDQASGSLKLYNFVDNHDVERIYTKLKKKEHFTPVHILLYTLPGIPSLYYGSEFGIEGKKERYSDDSLRPALSYEQYADAVTTNPYTKLLAALGNIHKHIKALSYGDYKEVVLTNTNYAFSKSYNKETVYITVNNADSDCMMTLPVGSQAEYTGALWGSRVSAKDGRLSVPVKANSGEIWILSDSMKKEDFAAVGEIQTPEAKEIAKTAEAVRGEEIAETAEAVRGEEIAETAEVVREEETAKTAEVVREEEIAKTAEAVRGEEIAKTAEAVREEETSETAEAAAEEKTESSDSEVSATKGTAAAPKSYEEMSIEELQEAILERMRRNGPLTDQMIRDVRENVYHNSLLNWIRSFR